MKELLAVIVVISVTITTAVAWVRHDQVMMTPNMVPDDYMCVYSKSADIYECGDAEYMRGFHFLTGE